MLLCHIVLDDITDEKIATDVVEILLDKAIEVKSAQRGRTKKIKHLVGKMEAVRLKCIRKGWERPLNDLKVGFEMMKEAKVEMDNLFSEMFEIQSKG